MAATEEPVVLAGEPIAIVLEVPPTVQDTVRRAADGDSPSRMFLNLEGLRAEHNPGVVYGVYLNLPPDGADADRLDAHVGNVAPFGIEHMRDADRTGDGPPGMRHVFDVTSRVRALQEAGQWDPASLTVTFEIIAPIPPEGEEATVDAILEEQLGFAKAEPLSIGRVSLFVS
ncbi:MAG: hypothetical protein ABR613_03640 [Actinomycetota bacterium]